MFSKKENIYPKPKPETYLLVPRESGSSKNPKKLILQKEKKKNIKNVLKEENIHSKPKPETYLLVSRGSKISKKLILQKEKKKNVKNVLKKKKHTHQT